MYPALQRVYPTLPKGEINKQLKMFVELIAKKHPKGHSGFYTIPGTEDLNINRPVVSFDNIDTTWKVTPFSKLIEPSFT